MPATETPIARDVASRAEASSECSESKKKKSRRPWLEKRRKGARLKPGQPHVNSLLTDELEEKILGLIRGGATWGNACRICGVSIAAVEDWKNKGECLPDSRYAKFLEKAEKAVMQREVYHVQFIARDNDWKARRWLLMNWHPERYKDRWYQELSGPNGEPVPVAISPFNVTVTLAANSEQLEREFTIHEPAKNGNGA
jgi:hypothetical protein